MNKWVKGAAGVAAGIAIAKAFQRSREAKSAHEQARLNEILNASEPTSTPPADETPNKA